MSEPLPEDLSGLTLEGRYDVVRPLLRSGGRTIYLGREQPGDRVVAENTCGSDVDEPADSNGLQARRHLMRRLRHQERRDAGARPAEHFELSA